MRELDFEGRFNQAKTAQTDPEGITLAISLDGGIQASTCEHLEVLLMGDVPFSQPLDDFLFLSTPRLRVGFYWKGGYAPKSFVGD